MAKRKDCPICKKEIAKHSVHDAIECVNDLELQADKITAADAVVVGTKYGKLKGVGQKHADRNIITLFFGSKPVETKEPEVHIFRNILESVKEKKDEGSKSPAEKGPEVLGDSEGSASGE